MDEEVIKQMPFISGFDLTGLEEGNNPEKFRNEFREIFKSCLPITIHAGEETSSKYIWEAAYQLNADRIGHGLSLIDQDPETRDLLQRFKDFGKVIELCPSSNFLTQEGFRVFSSHDKYDFYYFGKSKLPGGVYDSHYDSNYPLAYFLDQDLNVVICTDDPAQQNTTLSEEFLWASKMMKRKINKKPISGMSKWEALHLIRNSFAHCFLPFDAKKILMELIESSVYKFLKEDYYE